MALQYFLAGVGVVSIVQYQSIKRYHEKMDRDLQVLLKEHKAVANEIINGSS
jgi:hypothetical protein